VTENPESDFCVAVWDVRDGSWEQACALAIPRSEWLKAHALPADRMWRAEFYLVDAPFVRAFCYAADEDGNRYMDEAGLVAIEPPVTILLNELPPGDLMGTVTRPRN
jgi:hypothetical protein